LVQVLSDEHANRGRTHSLKRHLGGANYLWIDWHVTWILFGQTDESCSLPD